MTNAEIAKTLRNVAASYAIKNEDKYRFQIIAYQRAADAIKNSTAEIKELFRGGKLEQIPGVGPSLKSHLEELIKTGKVKHFEWVFKDIPETVFALMEVPSFGPKKAYRLVREFHLIKPKTVIDDLEKIAQEGKIAPLEGFGEKSQADILRSLDEYRQGFGKTTRMALPYASELAEKLVGYLKKSKDVLEVHPLGSLRRKVSTIGDIDIAVSTKNPQKAIDYFINYPHKERVIEKGPVTASILVSSGKQIDLMTQPPESFGSLLQHFTGGKHHNVHLREYALKKGFSLSERGIKKLKTKNQEVEQFATEEKFYRFLGLDWIPPELREDTGEIEKAIAHKLPKLITLEDIKGDLHIHSDFPIEPSHDMGKNSMEDMLEVAKKKGYEYLGFSEHNPSVSKHTSKQIYEILSRRNEIIEQLNQSKKYIRILSLLETDITPSGELAIDRKAMTLLDAVLVSIHSSFSMNKKSMTKRILKGLSHPKAKILTHPTGRLINVRPGYEVDFDEIFDFCKKHDKALEINAWPTRLDLSDIMVKETVQKGVKVVIDTDAHASWQMDMMQYGVAVARRGWAQKKDVLNTLPYHDFATWLRN